MKNTSNLKIQTQTLFFRSYKKIIRLRNTSFFFFSSVLQRSCKYIHVSLFPVEINLPSRRLVSLVLFLFCFLSLSFSGFGDDVQSSSGLSYFISSFLIEKRFRGFYAFRLVKGF